MVLGAEKRRFDEIVMELTTFLNKKSSPSSYDFTAWLI